jgi:hypothetical protein
MQRHSWVSLAMAIAALAGVWSVAGVSARPAPAGIDLTAGQRAQAAPTAVAPGTYAGKVTANTTAGLSIHGNDGDRTVVVQPGAVITRNGKTVAVSDLKNGDDVTMTVAQNGVVQSINATSKKGDDLGFLKWLIPLLIVLLLLLGLLLWLLSQRKQKSDFVVERRSDRSGVEGRSQATRDDFTVEQDRDVNQRPRM